MRHFYGAGPGHLLAMVVCLAPAASAVLIVAGDPAWPVMLAWFLAAVLLHDFVLFPVYAAADRALTFLTVPAPRAPRRVPAINHVRVPLLGAGLTFLLFFPGIVGQGDPTLRAASGLDQSPFLGRWLALVGAMALVSALLYLVRVRRGRSPHREQQVVHGEGEHGLGGEPDPGLPTR